MEHEDGKGGNYMTTKEKREHARRPLNIPVDITVQDRFYHGRVKNISKDGAFIETTGVFSVGQEISFIHVDPKGFGVKFGHRG